MDKLILKACKFYGYHGSSDGEKVFGQPFTVDIEMYLANNIAGETDSIKDAVDYGSVYSIIEDYVEKKSFLLVECLAEEITKAIFKEFDIVEGIKLTIKKPQAKLVGKYEYVAIEIERFRK